MSRLDKLLGKDAASSVCDALHADQEVCVEDGEAGSGKSESGGLDEGLDKGKVDAKRLEVCLDALSDRDDADAGDGSCRLCVARAHGEGDVGVEARGVDGEDRALFARVEDDL